MSIDEDRKIVMRLIMGDAKAFSVLVDRYQNLVFHVTKKIIPEQADAEDVCQEVFVKIHKNIGTFKYQSKLSTWIASIAYFTALNHLKKNKRYQNEDFTEDLLNIRTDQDDPEELLVKKSTTAYINKLIAQLPENYRVVLTLYHLEEFSIEEINETTGMPEGTIKNYLFRARKLLKDKVKHYLKEDYEER
ncbi:RNA polymerase sigma factor [Pedobacter sp. Hv1]|uniref:RNA polymerase sigma factor n=1 Tax=Pedobacter sp. Hv1 TaxID=1740090 RepID=UPI0006D8C58E|nr:sigma-70 family RNA polymerase sigma factor [Pedobacter sp. Hv1]KQC00386.1 RNA polymerase subunit sigma-24 [Pedobacter sp. Hv1]